MSKVKEKSQVKSHSICGAPVHNGCYLTFSIWTKDGARTVNRSKQKVKTWTKNKKSDVDWHAGKTTGLFRPVQTKTSNCNGTVQDRGLNGSVPPRRWSFCLLPTGNGSDRKVSMIHARCICGRLTCQATNMLTNMLTFQQRTGTTHNPLWSTTVSLMLTNSQRETPKRVSTLWHVAKHPLPWNQ